MDEAVQRVRVVLVSPGDVAAERAAAQAVVEELNDGEAADRGVVLSLWRWETDASPGLHLEGPQGQIDEQMRIEEAALVVGIFCTRFGTPTHDASSGTEHELRRALAAWKDRRRPDVKVYFCARPAAPSTQDEVAQWSSLIAFRDELQKLALTSRYESTADFERQLRKHLGRFLREREPGPRTTPNPASGTGDEPRVLFNLPPVAASFTGRERELDAIDEALGVARRAVITQAITGLGGVGKSQLAARYVQRSADSYDIVAWIRAQDGGIADLAELVVRLGLPVAGLSPNERAQRALDWLSSSDRRWLLALDNVESPAQLERLLPRGGNGRVLVTSRDRALRQFAPVLAVKVFDEDAATTYLVERAGRKDDEEAARVLAGALGCLPLALAHAAAYCDSGTSFGDYHELLAELPARELFSSHPEESYERTVASTWRTSIEAARAGAPLASDILEMASYLGPDAIPKKLFEVLVDQDSPAARHRLAVASNALARFSLATVDDTTVSVHRLLQKTVRDDTLARGDDTAAHNALRGVDATFARSDDTNLPETWPLCEQLLPHAFALAEAMIDPGESAPHLIGVLNRACHYLYYAGGGKRAVDAAEATRRYAERMLDGEHQSALTARANVAFSLRSAGRTREAIPLGEAVLADSERILGHAHADTLFARTDLASSYHSAGRTDEATALHEGVLADRERILGPQHPDTLRARSNLASSYRWAGRTKEAITIQEEVLADRERILGPKHPDTLRARASLAGSYVSAGRTKEAITIQEEVLADSERILGPQHPDTLTARSNLASSYRSAGRTKEAITIEEAVLADRERILGPKHPDTVGARAHLANSYLSAGRTKEAITIQEEVLADSERILGPQHPNTLTTRANVARSYRSAGRTKEAIALQESVLADCRRILGPEHPTTAESRAELASAYRSAGHVAKALALEPKGKPRGKRRGKRRGR